MSGKGHKIENARERDERAKKEAVETLGLMSSVPSQAPPFFYTRLKARMENSQAPAWERWTTGQLRPALAVAGLSLLLLVNIYCVWKASEQTAEAKQQQAASSIAEDYEFSVSQY
jgi:hypothetical protein